MSTLFNRFSHFPKHHEVITPSDSVNLAKGDLLIYCGSAGTIAVHDTFDVPVTYTVAAGDVLPVLVKRVLFTGTTVTPVIGLY
jgi:hypothetical protein